MVIEKIKIVEVICDLPAKLAQMSSKWPGFTVLFCRKITKGSKQFNGFEVKVSKFLKQIFMFSFEPKNERNYFLISALASKNGSNQKINQGTLLY